MWRRNELYNTGDSKIDLASGLKLKYLQMKVQQYIWWLLNAPFGWKHQIGFHRAVACHHRPWRCPTKPWWRSYTGHSSDSSLPSPEREQPSPWYWKSTNPTHHSQTKHKIVPLIRRVNKPGQMSYSMGIIRSEWNSANCLAAFSDSQTTVQFFDSSPSIKLWNPSIENEHTKIQPLIPNSNWSTSRLRHCYWTSTTISFIGKQKGSPLREFAEQPGRIINKPGDSQYLDLQSRVQQRSEILGGDIVDGSISRGRMREERSLVLIIHDYDVSMLLLLLHHYHRGRNLCLLLRPIRRGDRESVIEGPKCHLCMQRVRELAAREMRSRAYTRKIDCEMESEWIPPATCLSFTWGETGFKKFWKKGWKERDVGVTVVFVTGGHQPLEIVNIGHDGHIPWSSIIWWHVERSLPLEQNVSKHRFRSTGLDLAVKPDPVINSYQSFV